jgi:hypothetical protein
VIERVFCCGGGSKGAYRSKLSEEATKKVNMETDLSEMVKLMREVKFLRKLSSDGGDFSSLIRYSLEYRHKVDGSKFKDK